MPAYPREDGEETVRLIREREFPTWIGKTDLVIRLSELVTDALERAYNDAVRDRSAEHDLASGRADRFAESMRNHNRVAGQGGRISREGPLVAIFSEMDAAEIGEIEIGNRPYLPIRYGSRYGDVPASVVVKLGGSEWPYSNQGAVLQVAGDDRQWVGGTFDLLSSEMSRAVPWWAFVGRIWFRTTFAVIAALGVGGITFGLGWVDSAQAALLSVITLLLFALISLAAERHGFGLRKFEVFEPGTSPRSRTVLVFGWNLLMLAIGVVGLVLALNPRS